MAQLSILFVDDSDLDVMLAVRALRSAGYEIRYDRVERAGDLVDRLSTGWDVVVCDHQMPEFDALSALRLHREAGGDTPFLILSGAMPDAMAIDAMREGARDFIHKDNIGRLVPAIERELRDARGRELLRQTQASVDRLLHCDMLTGLGNVDALMQRLTGEIAGGRAFTLFLVDLDRFQRISQTLGMVAGNRILRVVAMRLESLVVGDGEAGFAARVGIDRFALLRPGLHDEHAVDAFGRAVHAVLQEPARIDDQDLIVTAGIGAAAYPAHGYRADVVLRAAEAALDVAKRSGVRRATLYEPGMGSSDPPAMVFERALHRAVAERQFVLHYQPQVELEGGRPVAVEALLRWQAPERGLVAPGEFIPSLEESGLILAVGEWVIEEATRQLMEWRDAGLPRVRMAINLSALQFRQPEFVTRLAERIAEVGADPSDIELEITEGLAMGDEENTIATLSALKTLGVRLAIDDFGTGYSSLAYLRHFPVDCLKIDRSFLRSEAGGAGYGVARAVVAMGTSLNLATVAEGIEHAEQCEAMKTFGCHHGQGFHFARPMNAADCTRFLGRWT
jgi:diguanylate cyclase (GGDEF)-like protein